MGCPLPRAAGEHSWGKTPWCPANPHSYAWILSTQYIYFITCSTMGSVFTIPSLCSLTSASLWLCSVFGQCLPGTSLLYAHGLNPCLLLSSNTNHSSASRSLHHSELPPLTLPNLCRSSSSVIYMQTPRICDMVLHCNMQQTHYFKSSIKVANSYFLFPQRKWNLTFQDLILNVVPPKSRHLSHCTWLICKLLFPSSSLQHPAIESLKPKTPPTPGTPSYRTGDLHSIPSATHLPQKLRN